MLGGAVGVAAKRGLRENLKRALIFGRSVGDVVYFGGEVNMELALPVSPWSVSVSTL